MQNSLSGLEPHSMDSLDHQNHAKKLSPKISLNFKVLCESKATLTICHYVYLCILVSIWNFQKIHKYICTLWNTHLTFLSPKKPVLFGKLNVIGWHIGIHFQMLLPSFQASRSFDASQFKSSLSDYKLENDCIMFKLTPCCFWYYERYI